MKTNNFSRLKDFFGKICQQNKAVGVLPKN